jgi:hypothetical protein
MANIGKSLGGHLFANMQQARKALRHRAHVYANTKDRAKRDAAGEELDKAALTLALSASLWGMHADVARPAGKAGNDWYAALDPESAIELDALAKKPRLKKKRYAVHHASLRVRIRRGQVLLRPHRDAQARRGDPTRRAVHVVRRNVALPRRRR